MTVRPRRPTMRTIYLQSLTHYLLRQTPEQRAEILDSLEPKWRRAFDQEIERQMEDPLECRPYQCPPYH
jgi:hypothetical protein